MCVHICVFTLVCLKSEAVTLPLLFFSLLLQDKLQNLARVGRLYDHHAENVDMVNFHLLYLTVKLSI